MTLQTFLKELRRLTQEKRVTWPANRIQLRVVYKTREYCPVTFVYRFAEKTRTRPLLPESRPFLAVQCCNTAGVQLGLEDHTIQNIVITADELTLTPLREKLLRACGVKSGKVSK